jgi:hypothetical protein
MSFKWRSFFSFSNLKEVLFQLVKNIFHQSRVKLLLEK